MTRIALLSPEDQARVSAAVTRAEAHTAGEIVTIVTGRSDGYADIALAWSALAALAALLALAVAPDFYLGLYERIAGGWIHDWPARRIFALAAAVAALKFLGAWALQLWTPLRLALVPPRVKDARVRESAIRAFRVGAERRTLGRTGIVIYLSMRERRAEIVADEAIAGKVAPEVWGEAMAEMIARIRERQVADGLCAAVGRVGAVLAEHFPRADDDRNELPDRLIET